MGGRKKIIILGLFALLTIILLFPIPLHLKDGGTVVYKAVLYSVHKVHSMDLVDSELVYLEGTIVEILGFEVFNNVETPEPSQKTNQDTQEYQEYFQESFTVGGIEVSASEAYQTLTDTELTDAVERLLADKYGEEFCCEQYIYYEEFSLLMDLTAYPAADPELRFAVDVRGADQLELWWDKYYNELYREDIDRYIYEAVASDGIDQEEIFVNLHGMMTTVGVSAETFYQQGMNIMICIPEHRVEEVQDSIQDIIEDIYANTQSEHLFWIYLCTDGIHGWEDFRYDGIWESYRVEYTEEYDGGVCLWGEKQPHLDVFLGSTPGLFCELPIQNDETTAASQGDYPAMVVVDGVLYKDTGKISTELRCGMMDGEITSTVDTVPVEDDQSNFGTGYGYQYGMSGIEVSIDGEWHIFEPYTDGE
ncbi:MAG: hypothetical protein K2K96_13390 [Lachnospiraceae bacterium]|nr:hypothetical protein [Lachnospiraceae bacterium]